MYQTFYFSVLTALSPTGMDSGFVETKDGINGARICINSHYPKCVIIELFKAHNGKIAKNK